MKKRMFTLLLVALLLTSCGSEGTAETETAADKAEVTDTAAMETEETLAGPKVPDKTYDGADFTIYSRENTEPYFDQHKNT